MAHPGIAAAQRIEERHVLQRVDARDAPHSQVSANSHPEIRAKVLVMPGPGIMRDGIQPALQLGNQVLEGHVTQVIPAEGRVHRIPVRFRDNPAPNSIGAQFNLSGQVRQPGRGHDRIRIRGSDDAVGLIHAAQPLRRAIHEPTPRVTDVGLLWREVHVTDVHAMVGELAADSLCDQCGIVSAVVGEDENFVLGRRQRMPRVIDLAAQCAQRRRDRRGLIPRRDDRAEPQVRIRFR